MENDPVDQEPCIHDLWPPESCTICLPRPMESSRFDDTGPPIGKRVLAKFDGQCKGCNLPTYRDQTYMRWTGKRWVCSSCYASET